MTDDGSHRQQQLYWAHNLVGELVMAEKKTQTRDSQIMPAVTVHIPMPPGAAVPAPPPTPSAPKQSSPSTA